MFRSDYHCISTFGTQLWIQYNLLTITIFTHSYLYTCEINKIIFTTWCLNVSFHKLIPTMKITRPIKRRTLHMISYIWHNKLIWHNGSCRNMCIDDVVFQWLIPKIYQLRVTISSFIFGWVYLSSSKRLYNLSISLQFISMWWKSNTRIIRSCLHVYNKNNSCTWSHTQSRMWIDNFRSGQIINIGLTILKGDEWKLQLLNYM